MKIPNVDGVEYALRGKHSSTVQPPPLPLKCANPAQTVKVIDVRVPFSSMVILILTFWFGTAAAMIILGDSTQKKPVVVVFSSDWHLGSLGCNYEQFIEDHDYLRSLPS
ncbi:unnamed protein product, partial [marine sediment metagenome]